MKDLVSTELVEDISANNDWTSVRVMHKPSMSFGKPYATNGFIHPRVAHVRSPSPEPAFFHL